MHRPESRTDTRSVISRRRNTGHGWSAIVSNPPAERTQALHQARMLASPLLRDGMMPDAIILSLVGSLYDRGLTEAEAAAATVLAHCDYLIREVGL